MPVLVGHTINRLVKNKYSILTGWGEKIKGWRIGICRIKLQLLDAVAWEDLIEKVSFKQNPEGHKGALGIL